MPGPPWTPAAGLRVFFGYATAVFIAVGAAAALSEAAAAPTMRERLSPDGVDGALVLCGEKIPEAALDRFCDLAGKDKASLVVLFGKDKADRETAEKLAEALKARKPASIVAIPADLKNPKTAAALLAATGAWLVGGASLDEDALKEVRRVAQRGAVGASGAAAAALANPADGAALLPGVVLAPHFGAGDNEESLFAELDKTSGSFGVDPGEGAALVVQGRQMSVVGDGTVTICLAKSPEKARRTIELTEKTPSDFTMLRRAALARAEPPFPPGEIQTPEVPKGSLVIVGGGGMPADVTKKFIELAGGPDASIVVLPTASPETPADSEGGFFRRAGARNVVALPARKLEEVEDPKNLEVLKKADAIWFGGGRQWHFVDAYEGTTALALFRDVLRRGGVIGGSSAGATIQGGYLCRGSPLNNTEMMCEGYERGFGFLPGAAIDQHFAQRRRFGDMTALVKAYPQLLGVGLDEATALVVRGREATVMGKGQAHFYDRNKPVIEGRPDYEAVGAGGRYDLKARKVIDPGGERGAGAP